MSCYGEHKYKLVEKPSEKVAFPRTDYFYILCEKCGVIKKISEKEIPYITIKE